MECAECGASYPSPQMIDGIAYFVCAQCGNLHELDDYQLLDLAGQAARFARESGFTLPAAYLDYAGRSGSWMVRVPPAQSESLNGYFGDGFYEIGQFFDLDRRLLLCATHGAVYDPRSGACRGGPCRGGGLEPLPVCETEDAVWLLE